MTSSEILLAEITLTNGLGLFLFDQSRQIAGDRWLAKLSIQIPIEIRPEYLAALAQGDVPVQAFIASTGGAVSFEYSTQRNFINRQELSQTLAYPKDDFFSSTLPYISKPGFEARFPLKRYQYWCEEQRLQRALAQCATPLDAPA
jgi:hypothetical protein